MFIRQEGKNLKLKNNVREELNNKIDSYYDDIDKYVAILEVIPILTIVIFIMFVTFVTQNIVIDIVYGGILAYLYHKLFKTFTAVYEDILMDIDHLYLVIALSDSDVGDFNIIYYADENGKIKLRKDKKNEDEKGENK